MNYTGYNTICDYLSYLNIPDGIHSMELENGEIIDFEIYNYLNDIIFDKTPVLGDNVADTKMLILKFHKNLTINEGVTIIPQVRKKGMTIYCAGTIENNGTISMTARGANAQGQDVLLYKNKDGSYEFVPKVGADGGQGFTKSGYISMGGNSGFDGKNRQTGGGGSGGIQGASGSSGTAIIAKGGNGTSYSGGSGSGAITMMYDSGTVYRGGIASDTGGKGGDAVGTSDNRLFRCGGIGNPNGASYGFTLTAEGTGGLVIIYCSYIINNGIIQACGISRNGNVASSNQFWGVAGGSSGGGSINIFYINNYQNSGTINANGGKAVENGSKGGDGSVVFAKIEIYKKYYLIKNNDKYKYYLDNEWHNLLDSPNLKDFLNYGVKRLSDIPSDLWTQLSGKAEILLATDSDMAQYIIHKSIPKSQLLITNSDIKLNESKIVNSIMSEDITTDSFITRLLSVDEGKTWLYFEDGWKEFIFVNPPPAEHYPSLGWDIWIDEDHTQDIENIKQIGLSQEQLTLITKEQWATLFTEDILRKKIIFITLLGAEDSIPEAKNLKISHEKYEEYISNTNFKQTQKTDKIIVTPLFNSSRIKINYML